MALVDATTWQQQTGTTVSPSDLSALEGWCEAADAALRAALRPFVPEPVTVTDILDAPPTRDLVLRHRPVRAVTSLYLNPQADGVSSRFDAASLLTAGQDYELLVDDPANSLSRCGIVRRLGGRVWGVSRWTRPGSLSAIPEGLRGAVRVTANVGPSEVPADIQAAAVLTVSLLWQRRKTAQPVQGESWNGYSVSWAGSFATSAVRSPDVQSLLLPYLPSRFV